MLRATDAQIHSIIAAEEWVFITNNEKDFIRLARTAELHPGLIVIPQGTASQQRSWFKAIIKYVETRAAQDGETPADWMVCRLVDCDESCGSVAHSWLP